MKLRPEPFDKIASGAKRIELRLFDEKRQQLNFGDTITFIREPQKGASVTVKVIGLLRYATFQELVNDFSADFFGSSDKRLLVAGVRRFYSEEDEAA